MSFATASCTLLLMVVWETSEAAACSSSERYLPSQLSRKLRAALKMVGTSKLRPTWERMMAAVCSVDPFECGS